MKLDPLPNAWMNGLTDAAPLLAEAAVRSLAVLTLAAGLALLLRRRLPAAGRHLLWLLALLSLPLLPLLSLALPQWRLLPAWPAVATADHAEPFRDEVETANMPVPLPLSEGAGESQATGESASPSGATGSRPPVTEPPSPLPSPPAEPEGEGDRAGAAGSLLPSEQPGATGSLLPVLPPSSPLEEELRPAPAESISAAAPAAPLWPAWLVLAYLAGASLSLAWLLLGLPALRRLRRASRPVADGPLHDQLQALCRRLAIRRPVALRLGGPAAMPLTWGTLRPAILLPAEAEAWPPARLEAVLRHELAHVQRWDCLTHLLGRLAAGLYWFNPLAHLALRRMALEREQACDDRVLAAGTQGPDYAEHLLGVVTACRPANTRPSPLPALGMARPSTFEGRLLAILDPQRNRKALTRVGVLTAVLLLAAIVVPVAMLQGREAEREQEQPSEATGADATTDAAMANAETGVTEDTFTARLPGGVEVELLGLAPHPSAGQAWWRPDGSPLEVPPATEERPWLVSGGDDPLILQCAVVLRGAIGESPAIFPEDGGSHRLSPQVRTTSGSTRSRRPIAPGPQ